MKTQKNQQNGRRFNPAGLCIGLSAGLCFGTAMGNMGLGIYLSLGIGLRYCVALGRHTDDGDKDGKQ